MNSAQTIPLRFQKAELQDKAELSAEALAELSRTRGPGELIDKLGAMADARDAVSSLALMLPHRQTVWWACLAARLIPDLAARANELAAVEIAESWVQTQAEGDCEQAFAAWQKCDARAAGGWAAMAAHWSGTSIAPRGQAPVPPARHLPGIATRTAMIFTVLDASIAGRIGYGDLLAIGKELMHGELGRRAQAAARDRIAMNG
jgi:hypothetical protein